MKSSKAACFFLTGAIIGNAIITYLVAQVPVIQPVFMRKIDSDLAVEFPLKSFGDSRLVFRSGCNTTLRDTERIIGMKAVKQFGIASFISVFEWCPNLCIDFGNKACIIRLAHHRG